MEEPERVSIWELACYMNGEDPTSEKRQELDGPVSISIRLLLNEIYQDKLKSDLIHEDTIWNHQNYGEYCIRNNLQHFWDADNFLGCCIYFMQSTTIGRDDFFDWCSSTGRKFAGCWPSNTRSIIDDYGLNLIDEPDITEKRIEKLPISQKEKKSLLIEYVLRFAERQWLRDPQIRKAHMVRHPVIAQLTARFTSDTVARWLAPVTPDSIKNNTGRPPKNI